MYQTILGAGGVISNHTALELNRMGKQIRLVSRNPKKVNDSDELFSANLLDTEAVKAAVSGSEVVYLTAGLKYDKKVWRAQWPVVMKNTIEACKMHNARLVFFDNVYAYGTVDGVMTELTPIRPSSQKGEVRAGILNMLLHEMQTGNLKALVARSADFYGPNTPLSFVQAMVFDKLHAAKSPQWMISDRYKHSFTYTPDAGSATALLGNTDDAYGKTWHLPTDPQLLSGAEFLDLSKKIFGVNKSTQMLPKWMLKILGVFIPVLGESTEMLYQNERDYIFDSTKFFARFPDFKYVPYADGIKNIAQWYEKKGK